MISIRIGVALAALVLGCVVAASPALADVGATPDDQLSADFLAGKKATDMALGPKGNQIGQAHARFGIANTDTLVNWNDHYFAPGINPFGDFQQEWFTNTVGNPPAIPGTTTINAPIVPVTLDLRNFDGSPRFVNGQPLVYSPTQYVQPVLNSPVFTSSSWSSSSTPTQITDAIQRAEYANARPTWHTLLSPSVKTGRVMTLIRGTYAFALNADGTCCRYVLVDANTFVNKLFPAAPGDTTTPIGAAENAGDITTKDMSTFLFPNTYLYVGSTSNCCILGFHSFDYEPGDASNGNRQRFYVMNYSSWISPGLFGGGFSDVTALSHEIAETYNDPFVAYDGVHDITPWWLAPQGNCQDNLETGDVIEGLPNGTYPITMNSYTYHPQNEALLQWFQFKQPSDALDGAYSYPNESVLTAPSAFQNPGCQ